MRLMNMFSLIAFAFSSGLTSVKDCSSGSHTGHITLITMDPPAPISGDWVTISIDYVLDRDVTGGTAVYTAAFNGFPLTPTTDDLCTDLKDTTTPCPISAGKVNFAGLSQIGDGTTHGTIVATTTWKDQDGNQIICWGFSVRI